MKRFKKWLSQEKQETVTLLYSIPSIVVTLFTVSVVAMNILANKTIISLYDDNGIQYFALDGGFTISWMSFLCMDIITKHFGAKASNKISILAIGINILTSIIFWIVSIIPTAPELGDFSGIDTVLSGTWFVLLSSTIAFISSALLNNFINDGLGKVFKKNPDGKLAYVIRTYVSTTFGQLFDNLIFAVLAFMVFAPKYWGFSWTFVACLLCSVTGAAAELLMEIVFSPIGYRVCKRWKEKNIGQAYLQLISGENI